VYCILCVSWLLLLSLLITLLRSSGGREGQGREARRCRSGQLWQAPRHQVPVHNPQVWTSIKDLTAKREGEEVSLRRGTRDESIAKHRKIKASKTNEALTHQSTQVTIRGHMQASRSMGKVRMGQKLKQRGVHLFSWLADASI